MVRTNVILCSEPTTAVRDALVKSREMTPKDILEQLQAKATKNTQYLQNLQAKQDMLEAARLDLTPANSTDDFRKNLARLRETLRVNAAMSEHVARLDQNITCENYCSGYDVTTRVTPAGAINDVPFSAILPESKEGRFRSQRILKTVQDQELEKENKRLQQNLHEANARFIAM
jgi:hypothetical protein